MAERVVGKVKVGAAATTAADRAALDIVRAGLGGAQMAPRMHPAPNYPSPPPGTPAAGPRAVQDGPGDGGGEEPPEDGEKGVQAPPRPRTGHPEWFVMPQGGMPAAIRPGTPVAYVRMHARLTSDPGKGERQCMVSLLRVKDQDFAHQRLRGSQEPMRAVAEYAKGCIRVIDGHLADWGTPLTAPAGVELFWEDIGPAYRQQLINWYLATHQMKQEDRLDFFANCIDDRVAG